MNRRQLILGLIFGLILLVVPLGVIAVNLAVGQAGREQNVQEARDACLRAIPRNVAAINSIRASVLTDRIVAQDPKVPPAVRAARRREITKDNRYAIVLDTQTDQPAWRLMDNPVDQNAVRYGIVGRPPFTCVRAYPPASFLP